MLVAILILVIFIGLGASCLLIKVEKIHKESIKVITIIRQRHLVDKTIKDLEAKGWIVKEVNPIGNDHFVFAITIFK